MKDELIEIHIKIPKSQHAFMQDMKEHFGISMQDFIIKSTADNIEKLKKQLEEQK